MNEEFKMKMTEETDERKYSCEPVTGIKDQNKKGLKRKVAYQTLKCSEKLEKQG